MSPGRPPLKVFVSYSSKDEEFRQELETHLSLLRRQGAIDAWNFRKIMAGEEWDGVIANEFEAAELILILVSADFLASDYCYEVEMVRAIERHENGTARVIPVVVRPVDWKSAPIAKLQGVSSRCSAS